MICLYNIIDADARLATVSSACHAPSEFMGLGESELQALRQSISSFVMAKGETLLDLLDFLAFAQPKLWRRW